jgi:S1-C subfamily serine protease
LPQVQIDHRRGALLGVGAPAVDATGPAIVGTVQSGSVAEAAGIKVGDQIQKFEDQPVPNFKALTALIAEHPAGDEVSVEILRGGEKIDLKIKLGEWKVVD